MTSEPHNDFRLFDIESAPDEWDRLIETLQQNVFHLSPMLGAHRYRRMVRSGIVVSVGGVTAGAIGGLVTRDGSGQLFESLSFPPFHGQDRTRLLHELVAWLKAQGFSGGTFGSFSGGLEGVDDPGAGARFVERLEFVWNTEPPDTNLLQAMRSQHRRNLKKAIDLPMQLTEITKGRAWFLTRLRRAWEQRKGKDSGLRGWFNKYSYHHRLEKWLGRSRVGRLYGLFGATGEPLSVAYMLEDKRSSFYMLGSSSAEGYATAASVRLFWELARRYRDSGVHVLNLGGVPVGAALDDHDEHGVFRFKSAFGLTPITRRTLHFGSSA